jgi:hypothetical protein
VAEFAIYRTLAAQRRLAYTTPLKALSNQKFADFTRQYGPDRVGILTGDVRVHPRAPLVVMTTEILRNMLYTRSLEEIGYVVLDECHYMGDEGRGTVWEEVIINCPREVQLIALSATVANIGEIADWISLVHRPIAVVTNPHRPVPLQYLVADLAGEMHPYEAVRDGRARLIGVDGDRGKARSEGDDGRWYSRRVADPTVMIEELERRGWLPAIYFIFSRAGCERALESFLAEGKPLLARPQHAGRHHRAAERVAGVEERARHAVVGIAVDAVGAGCLHQSRDRKPVGFALLAGAVVPGHGRQEHLDPAPVEIGDRATHALDAPGQIVRQVELVARVDADVGVDVPEQHAVQAAETLFKIVEVAVHRVFA